MEAILAILAAVAGVWLAGSVFGGAVRSGSSIASHRRVSAAVKAEQKAQQQACKRRIESDLRDRRARRELEEQRATLGGENG